ncbi:MAG: hypothetical protein QME45_00330 [Clostridiales bacterium]|nr:hypothetical protein [Clostridiales bacterium]
MNLDFLKKFSTRMKKVGMHTLIDYNSMFKNMWKSYGFEESYEYINLIYAMLMFIMEQSLKDEVCTIDDIASYIDELNSKFFGKSLTYEQCKSLGDFIVNTILCDEGRAMYFKGYDFEAKKYVDIHISYVSNKIVYINDTVRRTSYYLTDDGYSLLLGTLEVENNMKLTIQEMIFKLHLEKADYSKAVDDIKQIFNLSRIQLQKIKEGIRRIRENVLDFSSEEYETTLNDDMAIIKEQRNKFKAYREHVKEKIEEFYEQGIGRDKLNDEDLDKLNNLGTINEYLSRVIGEQQKILSTHFDFKHAYSEALTGMTAVAAIKRINFAGEIYEPILNDVSKLKTLDKILRPLYISKPHQFYNINKSIQYQRVIRERDDDIEEELSSDEDVFMEEKERERREKLLKYRGVLEVLFEYLINFQDRKVYLSKIAEDIRKNRDVKGAFVPSVEIFREVMIELLKSNHINMEELKRESKKSIRDDSPIDFEFNKTVMEIVEEDKKFSNIREIDISKAIDRSPVKIYGIQTDKGYVKTVICTDIEFKVN